MESIRYLKNKFKSTEDDVNLSLKLAIAHDQKCTDIQRRGAQGNNKIMMLPINMTPQIQEIRRIMSEEIKIEREARAITRRRSSANSSSTITSSSVSRVYSPVMSEICDEPFADFNTHAPILLPGAEPVDNPFINSISDMDDLDRIVRSLCELSDTALNSVMRQVVQKRASCIQVFNQVHN
jgi:hypothetical protein